jgi:hypothetical protein
MYHPKGSKELPGIHQRSSSNNRNAERDGESKVLANDLNAYQNKKRNASGNHRHLVNFQNQYNNITPNKIGGGSKGHIISPQGALSSLHGLTNVPNLNNKTPKEQYKRM